MVFFCCLPTTTTTITNYNTCEHVNRRRNIRVRSPHQVTQNNNDGEISRYTTKDVCRKLIRSVNSRTFSFNLNLCAYFDTLCICAICVGRRERERERERESICVCTGKRVCVRERVRQREVTTYKP